MNKIYKCGESYCIHGDCLPVMQDLKLEDISFDLCICDPPYEYNGCLNWEYFINGRLELTRSLLNQGGIIYVNIPYDMYNDMARRLDIVFDTCNRVKHILWDCGRCHILGYRRSSQIRVPKKSNPRSTYFPDPCFLRYAPDRDIEGYEIRKPDGSAWNPWKTMYKRFTKDEYYTLLAADKIVWIDGNPYFKNTLFYDPTESMVEFWGPEEVGTYATGFREQIHTQKSEPAKSVMPQALIKRLISNRVGCGSVLDPFMGTAAVGEYCIKNYIDYVGIESEDVYHTHAVSRLLDAEDQYRNDHAWDPWDYDTLDIRYIDLYLQKS